MRDVEVMRIRLIGGADPTADLLNVSRSTLCRALSG